ncbi:gamma-glutamylaminecyclotransferase-like isoform X1 [Polyodon spathula]|uniref:gamma-glutamylaminecyclotransferase-like isoform X1 n=2 Tax=Polyodon spathula TaxID=7913 RepID=UPI001B7DEA06|nr:gamma-glutamylaminecyclotransferase-like isoform X1 [Polyodon spathula]
MSGFRPVIKMAQVFVYGTLKKGQPNYFRMTGSTNGNAEYCGKAHTVEKYPLVIAGPYNIPFLLNVPGSGHQVKGEIYSVDNQMLQFLDEFEGCPHMYQRTLVRLQIEDWESNTSSPEATPAVNSIVEAFVYSTTTYQPEWLNLPCHDKYDAYGEHGLHYCEPEARD